MNKKTRYPFLLLPILVQGLFSTSLPAQTTDEDVFELPPFMVRVDREFGYRATASVSASRAATALRDLPFSLQVITDELLTDLKLTDLEDIVRFVPALQENRDNLGNFGKFNVRGILQIYSLRNGFRRYGPNDTSSAAQVEVVKGPAGLLYGQVFPGGVVNVITKKPQPFHHYELQLRYGSYGSYRVQTDFGGPLNSSKTLLYRVVAAHESFDSFVQFNEREINTIVPSLTYAPTRWLSFTLEYEYFRRNEDAPHAGMIALNLADLELAIANPEDPFGMRGDFTRRGEPHIQSNPRVTGLAPYLPRNFNTNGPGTFSNFETKTWTLYTDVQPASWISFRSAVIYYDYMQSYYANFANNTLRSGLDMSARAQFFESGNRVFQTQNDFLLDFDTGPLTHRMLVGGEYYSDRFSGIGARERATPNRTNYIVRLPSPYDNVTREWNTEFIPAFNPIQDFAPSPRPEHLPTPTRGDDRETYGYAFYLTDQIVFWQERMRLLGGVRYERFFTDNFITGQEGDEDQVTFQVGGLFRINETFSLFTSYSESFYRNEFFNQFGPPGMAGKLAPPQLGDGIDFGVRIEALNNRLTGNIAYFDLNQTNILMMGTDEANNPVQRLSGARNSRGMEMDFHFAVTPGWQVIFNYAYLRTRDISAGLPFPNVPRHQGGLWTRYEVLEGALEGLIVGGGALYMGSRPGGNDSNILAQRWEFTAASYIHVDAFIAKRFERERFSFQTQFNVSNLTDAKYIRGGQTLPSEPRRYSVSLTLNF